ncbi:MAG: hypothetical protein AB8I08_28785 [Sandaracinaceae bacterium]
MPGNLRSLRVSRLLVTPNTKRALFLLAIVATLAAGLPAAVAQDAPEGLPDWVEDDPFSADDASDPLGIDRGDRLETVQPTTPEEELAPSVPVHRGAVLSAIAGVRETAHTMDIQLQNGLAVIRREMRFETRARHDAEIRYRLSVPPGASLASLEVCNQLGCRDGLADTSTGTLGPYDDAVRARSVDSGLPVAHAALVEDRRGSAVWLRAAPVRAASQNSFGHRVPAMPLTVRVSYVVAAPVQGGRVRFELPARGHDNRVSAAEVRVRSDELSRGEVNGVDAVERPVNRVAWEDMVVTARLDRGGPVIETSAWTVRDGDQHFARVRVAAAPRSIAPRDVILLVDASPSTADGARGRIAPTVAALLSSLPSRSRVAVAAFAARAVPIVASPVSPTAISLTQVSQALEAELGSTTRFEAAWDLVAPWARNMRRPLLVLVGDGGLTEGRRAREAFLAARQAGVEVASLNLADRETQPALRAALEIADGTAIDAGAAADATTRGHGAEPLRERISRLFAPVVRESIVLRAGRERVTLGPLRAGEEQVWEGAFDGRLNVEGARTVTAPALLSAALADRVQRAAEPSRRALRLAAVEAAPVTTCRVSGRFESPSGVVRRGGHLALADTRRCDTPAVPERPRQSETHLETPGTLSVPDATSLPRRVLLDMLRQRLIPPARACYRDDRAGRANYTQRAVYRFTLADREVTNAEVVGTIAPQLRDCLVAAVDDLDVPRFEGTITVSYPLYTQAHLPPPTLSLDTDVADVVDAVVDDVADPASTP